MTLPQNRRILIIDDQPAIHDDFRRHLLSNSPANSRASSIDFEIDSALQGESGCQLAQNALAQQRPYALAFVDLRMPPGWDGMKTAKKLLALDPNLQIVICTDHSDHARHELADELESSDRFLLLRKNFDSLEVRQLALSLLIKYDLKIKNDRHLRELELTNSQLSGEMRVRRATEEKLAFASAHDPLTGLANRTILIDRLANCINRHAADLNYHYALLFLDLDRFKDINDSLGHVVGDHLLRAIADKLQETVSDAFDHFPEGTGFTITRLGGDEFTILVENFHASSLPKIAALAQSVVQAVNTTYSLGDYDLHISGSVGTALANLAYNRAEEVIRDADTAMYHAKSLGKNQHASFSHEMHEAVKDRLVLESGLRQAIELHEYRVFYQPVIRLDSGHLEGFEALARWQHPQRGLISPEHFIPLAEETGLIVPLGYQITRQACKDLHSWQSASPDMRHLTVAINLSRRQLSEPRLVENFSTALKEFPLTPGSLILEITESAIMANPASSIKTLNALRDMGAKLHLDDFGTGHSSLACLHSFPLNGLKIDRSFINFMSTRRDYTAVVQAIITLAQNLGIEVVAEGLEHVDQLVQLQCLDATCGQGYLFAKAMPAEAVPHYVKNFRPVHLNPEIEPLTSTLLVSAQ